MIPWQSAPFPLVAEYHGNCTRLVRQRAFMKLASLFSLSLLFAMSAPARQQPAAPPHEMEHMQSGGFMQGGMQHQVAPGVVLEQRTDPVTHRVTLRIGPMN